ncbi:PIG-L family deacetylase [Lusitaniella coriacea LEGE 07157]|uniref:PIG-L family deacetylase n=2 Tax=Lusitaniella TaxID=1983104 RepID=A0A8J7DZC9_9CYAN|nr:PIG-L family deacetylase [Lusitaniella coriacea LEGE 07157]
MGDRAFSSPTAIESLPLRSAAAAFAGCHSAVVVAPHPDDESLGCGGAIALLQQRSIPAHILVMSDGTQSHPQSKKYPPERLKRLRERETQTALQKLGLEPEAATFMGWGDSQIPAFGSKFFPEAVSGCRSYLRDRAPSLLFVPWQHDRHRDHRATWEIVQSCLQTWQQPPQQLAYAVWGSEAAGLPCIPPDATGWRLDIRSVESLKRQAVMAHQSQTTDLINDDPTGFRLTPTMLTNLIQPWETYLEVK